MQVFKWNEAARLANERRRVFAGSMCDVFEDYEFDDCRVLDRERTRLFSTIRLMPWLDWLLVTKRPENIAQMLPADWSVDNYPNAWLIATVENQAMADARIPALLSIPAVVHGLSCEPLLEEIDIECYFDGSWSNDDALPTSDCDNVDWVIVGGESGAGFRPMNLDWARKLRKDCYESNVPFFFKQESGRKPGTNALLDGVEYHEFPNPFPQK